MPLPPTPSLLFTPSSLLFSCDGGVAGEEERTEDGDTSYFCALLLEWARNHVADMLWSAAF